MGHRWVEWLDARKSTSPYLWPAARGTGARGSFSDGAQFFSGTNPWDPKSWNLTQQGAILKSDATLAKQLQEQVRIEG